MPIDKSWGEEEKVEYVVQVTDLREETVHYPSGAVSDKIQVDITDVNPDLAYERFPLSFTQSKHKAGKWMKFLTAIEHVGTPCKHDPNVLIGKFMHIREETDSGEINGEYQEWDFPRPLEVTDSEERAKEIFESLPKPSVSTGIDLDTRMELVEMYKNVKGSRKKFDVIAEDLLPEGMSLDEAFELAEAEAGEDIPF